MLVSEAVPYSTKTPKWGEKMNSSTTESLVVEVRIKNKSPENIIINNIHDAKAIDQEIRRFLNANSLKKQAFDYLKAIINKKIEETMKAKLARSNPPPEFGSGMKAALQNK